MRLVLVALAALALSGCSDSAPRTADPAPEPSEAATHPARTCPEQLSAGEDPDGYGFGTSERAERAPALREPDEAWTCRYDPVDDGTNSNGAHFEWVRRGAAAPVDPGLLPELGAALEEVAPFPEPEEGWGCTSDLGPRWLVVTDHTGDLTGIVVDDYGCREVRITDDPWEKAPGESAQAPGVLDGGTKVLSTLGIGVAR